MEKDCKMEKRCTVCGRRFVIPCTAVQKRMAENKEGLIQDIFPELPPDLRELFITGWCGDCFDRMLGPEE